MEAYNNTNQEVRENEQFDVQQTFLNTNLQNNIFNNLAMQANNITAGEEANDQENTAQEIHNNLEQGNSPKQQRKAQKKEEKNNSSGITAVELTSNKIHLNEVMVGVAVGGKDGGSKKNPTNIQVGVTKGVNLPHVMHEGD